MRHVFLSLCVSLSLRKRRKRSDDGVLVVAYPPTALDAWNEEIVFQRRASGAERNVFMAVCGVVMFDKIVWRMAELSAESKDKPSTVTVTLLFYYSNHALPSEICRLQSAVAPSDGWRRTALTGELRAPLLLVGAGGSFCNRCFALSPCAPPLISGQISLGEDHKTEVQFPVFAFHRESENRVGGHVWCCELDYASVMYCNQ